jgi:adenylate kinase
MNKEDKTFSEKLDLLININKNLQMQLQEQQKIIQELQKENQKILVDTHMMAKHIEFINSTYDKISTSYFFKHLFGN